MNAYKTAQKIWKDLCLLCNHAGTWEIKILVSLSLPFLSHPRLLILSPIKQLLEQWEQKSKEDEEGDEMNSCESSPCSQCSKAIPRNQERLPSLKWLVSSRNKIVQETFFLFTSYLCHYSLHDGLWLCLYSSSRAGVGNHSRPKSSPPSGFEPLSRMSIAFSNGNIFYF